MILRRASQLCPTATTSTQRCSSLPPPVTYISSQSWSQRCLHRRAAPPVPQPTPFVPDPSTFLTLIGRNMVSHSSKIPTWESLFRLTSTQLRDSGLEPARSRRYLLRWREKFRNGEFGIGGDLTAVKDGVAELRIVDVKSEGTATDLNRTAGRRRVVVNVEPGAEEKEVALIAEQVQVGGVKPVEGVKIRNWDVIAGKNVKLLKGGKAELRVMEGLWEHKRGRKVDGGERRKAEVRAKRRAAERKDT